MVKTFKLFLKRSTGLYGPVLFLLLFLSACKNGGDKVTIAWMKQYPVALNIPKGLLKDASQEGVDTALKIYVTADGKQPVLGRTDRDGSTVTFWPTIGLTAGMHYRVTENGRLIATVDVPANETSTPQVLTIYPETDTLPENTLKIYISFSRPMRTGHALDYLTLLDARGDTLHRVFLDLQPELWDSTETTLTVWLDPGRIKRGLVLNRELGNPLKKAQSYRLVVSSAWKDADGNLLKQAYTKTFVTGPRDDAAPDIKQWELGPPKAGTKRALVINLPEPLDHYLLEESISVLDNKGMVVKGSASVSNKDRRWQFTPDAPWQSSNYKLRVAARLEDLAGNNLNRVFDRDIYKEKQRDEAFYERGFVVK